MWLSALIALITYLLSPRGTSEERQKALINAGLAGGGTYLATQYTDWGKDVSNSFDAAIGVGAKTPIPAGGSVSATGATLDASGAVVKPAVEGAVGAPSSKPATGGSLWTTLAGWGPAALGFLGGSAASSSGSILPAIIVCGIIYAVLK